MDLGSVSIVHRPLSIVQTLGQLMESDRAILITGCSGMVGRELTARLLENTGAHLYLLLHRRGLRQEAAALLEELFGVVSDVVLVRRVHLLEGDVTKEQLGLSAG